MGGSGGASSCSRPPFRRHCPWGETHRGLGPNAGGQSPLDGATPKPPEFPEDTEREGARAKKGSPAAAEARPGQITRIHRGSQKKTRQAIKHQGWRAPQGRRISLRLQNLIQIEPPREVRRSPPPSHPIDFPHSASHTPTKTATPTERQPGQVGPGVAHLTHTRAACQASKSAGETMAGGHEKISPRAHWLGVAAGTGARGFGAWGRPGLDRRRGGGPFQAMT